MGTGKAAKLTVVVGADLFVTGPKDELRWLRDQFRYPNPEFYKRRARGYSTYGVPSKLDTATRTGSELHIWRGGASKLRQLIAERGLTASWRDARLSLPSPGLGLGSLVPRPYQTPAASALLSREQGYLRAPTGAGKTATALIAIVQSQQPALVVVWDSRLMRQWLQAIADFGILPPSKIGVIKGGQCTYGPITVGMQQSLVRMLADGRRATLTQSFGAVALDEAQRAPASTFARVLNTFPARYRWGLSADEKRRDGLEKLAYDAIGPVLHEMDPGESVLEVLLLSIETGYIDDPEPNPDGTYPDVQPYHKVLDRLTRDPDRNRLIASVAAFLLARGRRIIVFTEQREAALQWAQWADRQGYPSLALRGAANVAERNAVHEGIDRARRGEVRLIACTTAGDAGLDIPCMDTALVTCPTVKNRQRFKQQLGRIRRPSPGKRQPIAVYFRDGDLERRRSDTDRTLKKWPLHREVTHQELVEVLGENA